MKGKVLFQCSAVLLSAGLAFGTAGANKIGPAFAEEVQTDLAGTGQLPESEAAPEQVVSFEGEIAVENEEVNLTNPINDEITESQTTVPQEALTEAATTVSEAPSTEMETTATVEPSTQTQTTASAESSTEMKTEASSEETTETASTDVSLDETETSSEALQKQELTDMALNLDQDLEMVPVEFVSYIDAQDVYSVVLTYSDGTTKKLDQSDERFTLTVNYQDDDTQEDMLCRTYHAVLTDNTTGKKFEDTQSITFGKRDPVEIKTTEMTSVIVKGTKWIMVQSVPTISGRYAMNSDKPIEAMYYAAEDEEVICAEDAFELQEDVTYRFLIKLK